jgi:pimeloyl-ACP methyl ester carboxylesterase
MSDDEALEHFEARLPHGIKLACRARGPADAPVLLFLHGFPEAGFVWDGMLARFADRYRCVAPDLRGYGASSAPVEVEAYRARHLVEDLAALIGLMSPGRPLEALVAHDWGGAIGWALAIQQPALMRRAVMVNATHPGAFLRDLQSDPAQQAASRYMDFLRRPDAATLLAENDFARLWPFFTRMGGDAWLNEGLRERYRAVWRQGLDGALNWYRASPLHPSAGPQDPLHTIRLAPGQLRVQVPTTVLWGEADTALLPGLLRGLEDWVPDLRVVRFPTASHWIVHEQPEAVAREIGSALGR